MAGLALRRFLLQALMRTVPVVVPGVLSQDPAKMLVVLAATAGLLVRSHFGPGHLAAPAAGMLAVLQGNGLDLHGEARGTRPESPCQCRHIQ